jgi:endonuclease-3
LPRKAVTKAAARTAREKATRKASVARKSTAKKPARKAAPATRKTVKRPPPRRLRESQAARHERATRLLAALRDAYSDADCALDHRGPLELLVATILSAQCTDERVNMVTPELFRRYPNAAALAAAPQEALEDVIRSTGFFRNKAKSLRGMAQRIVADYGGHVPDAMDDLLRLPGVARKTANCVLGTAFGHNVGVVVDTHVGRIATRLAIAPHARDDKDAEKIERDLMELFPSETWTWLAHALIQHGRRVCTARKPQCERCPLAADCPSAGKI